MDESRVLIRPDTGSEKTWSPKYLPEAESSGFTQVGTDGAGKPVRMKAEAAGCAHPDAKVFCGERITGHTFVAAPWRSLIYRNVDAPFPYYDDYVPFPRMPMNTAGYDYRAPRLMGDWMVSLPAVRVDQSQELGHGENDLPSHNAKPHDGSYDDSPQPYVEVKPGTSATLKDWQGPARGSRNTMQVFATIIARRSWGTISLTTSRTAWGMLGRPRP